MRGRWKVALSGGPDDGKVVLIEALGRRLVTGANLYADGSTTWRIYDYTGVVPARRSAFARYQGEEPSWPEETS